MRSTINISMSLLLMSCVVSAATRPVTSINADLTTADGQIEQICIPQQLLDPKYRESVAPRITPLLIQRQQLLSELDAAVPKSTPVRQFLQTRNQAELAFFGDEKVAADLKGKTGSDDATEAMLAKISRGLEDWLNANGKPDEQGKVLDNLSALATGQPIDDVLARSLFMMIANHPASVELAARASDQLSALKSPFALAYKAMPNKVGKPLKVTGTTVAGKQFDSTKWVGKVVVIDFWATWCPPCMAALPHVAELYKQYHDQGLEIVGVSSDQTRPALANFLKEHPEVPWPQLFVGGNAWHPLTKQYGINAIPTVFLIDRAGVLRTMLGRSALDEMIPELLKETAPQRATTNPALKNADGTIR